MQAARHRRDALRANTYTYMYINVYVSIYVYTYIHICRRQGTGRTQFVQGLSWKRLPRSSALHWCHIIIHTMSHHHTYYVTSSYIQQLPRSSAQHEDPIAHADAEHKCLWLQRLLVDNDIVTGTYVYISICLYSKYIIWQNIRISIYRYIDIWRENKQHTLYMSIYLYI